MDGLSSTVPTVLAAFMASSVEFVEALTIVLAVGVVRGWRPALAGAAAGVASLVVIVAALGPALARLPIALLQATTGTLLLLFGLRWLRKAVLRAAGVLALHDEDAAYAGEVAAMRAAGTVRWHGLDTIAALATFKGVVLEGAEVVFIVIAIGGTGRGGALLGPAATGAGLALALVVVLGAVAHRPLSRVPENALKFGVGVLLSAFGAFWVGEALGLGWPGGDLAVLTLVGAFGLGAAALVAACARRHLDAPVATPKPRPVAPAAPSAPGPWRAVLRELAGLFVDDGWMAGAIVLVLAAFLAARPALADLAPGVRGVLLAGTLIAVLAASALRRAARS